MAVAPSYSHPPITEAVIEIRFTKALEINESHRVFTSFRSQYDGYQELVNYDIKVNIAGERVTQDAIPHRHYRFSSADMTQLVSLTDTGIAVSQLAPYPGWESFFDRFVRDWSIWYRCVGFRDIGRIGVRYINRLDIPIEKSLLTYSDYLNIYPKLPERFPPTSAYSIQVQIPMDDIGCMLSLNSAVVPSPLPNHASIVLDQDIARENQPPQNEADIQDLLRRVHDRKNEIFEECITEEARRLFRK